MRSIQIVTTLNPRSGGLAESVRGLSRALRKSISSIQILTNDRTEALDQFGLNADDRALVCSTKFDPRISALFRQQMRPVFSGNAPPDIVHSHGLWEPFIHAACSEAKRSNIKLVIQTHGMLDVWAMKQSWLKKKLPYMFISIKI